MTDHQRRVLIVVACLSAITIFVAPFLADKDYISQDAAISAVIVALCMGIFVIAGEVEKAFAGTLSRFGSAKIFWAIAIAAGGFFARKGGLEDVNAVFHIDPSALPMTLIAASVMYFVSTLKWTFIVITAASVVRSAINYHQERGDLALLGALSAFMALISFVFVEAQLHDQKRREKIYRIAHSTDFNSTFRCANVDETKYSVLFIGPDQRKILIAPKIEDNTFPSKPTPEIFRTVTIPQDFTVQDCIPYGGALALQIHSR